MSWKMEFDFGECETISYALSRLLKDQLSEPFQNLVHDLKDRIDTHLKRHTDLKRSMDDRDFNEGSG